jgi:TRAP-type uncharacterized transport system fused permease subunit
MFTYTPALLFVDFAWPQFTSALICGTIGIVALSAAYIGYFRAPLNRFEKALLSAAGIALVFNQFWPNVAGVLVVAAMLGWNALRAPRDAAARA